MATSYDNPNISSEINLMTSNLANGLENLTASIRNEVTLEMGTSGGMYSTISDVDDLKTQVLTLETKILSMENQLNFLINLFKKFEESGEDNIPKEVLSTYDLRKELNLR